EPVREERPVAGVRAFLRLDPADRQDLFLGLAGEQVAAARAAVNEQAVAGRPLPLDPRAVVGCGAGHERSGLLLDPAKRRDVVVRAEQDPGLAGAGLRGEIGLPLGERMGALGEPAGPVWGIAVA